MILDKYSIWKFADKHNTKVKLEITRTKSKKRYFVNISLCHFNENFSTEWKNRWFEISHEEFVEIKKNPRIRIILPNGTFTYGDSI